VASLNNSQNLPNVVCETVGALNSRWTGSLDIVRISCEITQNKLPLNKLDNSYRLNL